METGDKLIVLWRTCRNLTVQLGYYYGPGNPNNNGKDLAALTSMLPMDVASATRLAFLAPAAKLHAPYWGCHMMEHPWLTTGKNETRTSGRRHRAPPLRCLGEGQG